MALREKDARYVADLAHLELTEDELKKFIPQLDSILKYVEKLNELDTTAVEPMAQVTHTAVANLAIRPDVSRKTFDSETALKNAPEPGPGYFKVPLVIEKE